MLVPSKAYKEAYANIVWTPPPKRERRPEPPVQRSHLAAPGLIRDGMEPLINHTDGRRYDSKSAFRKATKIAGDKAGKTFVEVGNDRSFGEPQGPREYDNMGLKQDLKDSYDKIVGT